MLKEFREFIMRGNVLDLAIAVIIGAAFGAIVNSLVKDILTPIIGLALGGVDFTNLFVVLADPTGAGPYATLADAQAAGAVTINIGLFLNTIINFLIVAFVIFQIVRTANRLKRKEPPAAPTTKECPYCLSTVPLKATRCPNCTSQLTA
jgi:large conductance mechanosensitive channel